MALHDPIAAYNAANNVEAHLLCNLLAGAGIEAYVTEDVSQVGVWMMGFLPEIHKPQVWIERTNAARARPILEEYELRIAERNSAGEGTAATAIGATCEACGRRSVFPAAQRGSVQECPHCGEYMDVRGEERAEAAGDEESGHLDGECGEE